MTQSENSLQRLREGVLQLRETKEKKFPEDQGATSPKAQEISDKIEDLEKMIGSAAEISREPREIASEKGIPFYAKTSSTRE